MRLLPDLLHVLRQSLLLLLVPQLQHRLEPLLHLLLLLLLLVPDLHLLLERHQVLSPVLVRPQHVQDQPVPDIVVRVRLSHQLPLDYRRDVVLWVVVRVLVHHVAVHVVVAVVIRLPQRQLLKLLDVNFFEVLLVEMLVLLPLHLQFLLLLIVPLLLLVGQMNVVVLIHVVRHRDLVREPNDWRQRGLLLRPQLLLDAFEVLHLFLLTLVELVVRTVHVILDRLYRALDYRHVHQRAEDLLPVGVPLEVVGSALLVRVDFLFQNELAVRNVMQRGALHQTVDGLAA